jgi:toxin FitB
MLILDTNVLSALMGPLPDERVAGWLDAQPRASIWATSITVLEIRHGVQILPAGRRRDALMSSFEMLVRGILEGRIAPLDRLAAELASDLMAARQKKGRPGDLRDTMIAGIVLGCRATLATRNISHFEDLAVPVVNPWDSVA